ncbi:hypothetical protein [Kibdelosporangium persicum]|jgi:hypothetical protein|nr:hypothetical protein [Kibdelosporangium persicum]
MNDFGDCLDIRDWRERAKNDEKCVEVRDLATILREAAEANSPRQPR